MATRLDSVSRPAQAARHEPRTTSSTATSTRGSTSTGVEHALPTVEGPIPIRVPTKKLVSATAAWLSLTFALCYLIVPAIYAVLGLGGLGIFAFWPQFPGFLLAAAGAVTLVALHKPEVKLGVPSKDPVFAATAGSLGMWAVLQNMLLPFLLMNPLNLVALVGLNVVESLLVGTMVASFVKEGDRAFGLAAAFQLAVGILSVMIWMAVL